MIVQFLLSVIEIPSGFFILIGFLALIVLAIALWKAPKDSSDKTENLKPEPAESSESKE
jgi:hypothetical protein